MTERLQAGAALRWARALVLALVAASFAGAAHAAAGGSLPGPGALLVLVGVAMVVLAALLGRPASTLRIATLLAGGQAVLHAVLTAAGGHPAATSGATGPPTVGSLPALPQGRLADVLVAPDMLDPASRPPSGIAHAVAHLQTDLASPVAQRMAVAHLLAAAALGMWLAAGERLVWRLVVLLAGSASRSVASAAARVRAVAGAAGWTRPALLGSPPAAGCGWRAPASLRAALLTHDAPRRGPPAAATD